MSGWGTVSQESQGWSSSNFSGDQGFSSSGWGAATSEPQAHSSGWGGSTGGGDSGWQQMARQMESTFIGNDFEQRDDAPEEESRPRRPAPASEEIEAPIPLEETWPAFKEADESRDLDDVKEALGALCTSFRGSSWQDIEKKLREENCNTYLAALDHTVLFGYTLVNLKNEPEQQYRVIPSFIRPGTAKSGRMSIGHASSYNENFERLAGGGIVRPSGVTKCHNCKQDGHMAKDCHEEKRAPEKSEYFGKCYNCGSEEHRSRHCPEERKVIICNNCRKEGHISKNCTEALAALVRCGEMGHMARECSQSRTDILCNRCGEMGHMARDCSQPRTDMICRTCKAQGHIARECPDKKKTCYRCGAEGHLSSECDAQCDTVCYNCNQSGHQARDCPSRARDMSTPTCYNCGESGHMSFECPTKNGGGRRGPRKYGFGF
ncbi:hypothetical protein CPC16_004634 [Podila verticillata]|nr:hypothetical protein CPC16_004634 [Podila verticillata]